MEPVVLAAIVTALGGLAIVVAGWVVNKRLGIPSEIQSAIAQTRKDYEETLEKRNDQLEEELEEERQARAADKAECSEMIESLRRDLDEEKLRVSRLQTRIAVLERTPSP